MVAIAMAAGAGLRAADVVVLDHRVEKVEALVGDGGVRESRFMPAEHVYAGDELRYTITFTNATDETVAPNSIVVTNPVPESTEYVEGSANGPGSTVEFSVDGGDTFAGPEQLRVRDDAGEHRAPPAAYTTIRWRYGPPLVPGERSHVSFRVRML